LNFINTRATTWSWNNSTNTSATNGRTIQHEPLQQQWGQNRHRQQQQQFVRVMYFENATFQEQMEFFATVDIVITPHGAQSTGLFFLPICGAIRILYSLVLWFLSIYIGDSTLKRLPIDDWEYIK
jgi:hypothetical protein